MFLTQNACNFQYSQEAEAVLKGGYIYLSLYISRGRNIKGSFTLCKYSLTAILIAYALSSCNVNVQILYLVYYPCKNFLQAIWITQQLLQNDGALCFHIYTGYHRIKC